MGGGCWWGWVGGGRLGGGWGAAPAALTTSLSGELGRDPGSPFLVGVLASFLGNWSFFMSSLSGVTHSSRRLLTLLPQADRHMHKEHTNVGITELLSLLGGGGGGVAGEKNDRVFSFETQTGVNTTTQLN